MPGYEMVEDAEKVKVLFYAWRTLARRYGVAISDDMLPPVLLELADKIGLSAKFKEFCTSQVHYESYREMASTVLELDDGDEEDFLGEWNIPAPDGRVFKKINERSAGPGNTFPLMRNTAESGKWNCFADNVNYPRLLVRKLTP